MREMPRLVMVCLLAAGVSLLTGCGEEPPDYRPTYLRGVDLAVAFCPEAPSPLTGETKDEAEIQYRAAFQFYRRGKWNYAAVAFGEALDYDPRREDARFFMAVSLVMAGKNAEAKEALESLFDTEYEARAKGLLAVVLYRMGKRVEARAAAAEAAEEDYFAAGWAARYDLLFTASSRRAN
jgi:tetratricopeptide (TPR) repeat protein